jgi:hypothetical protein
MSSAREPARRRGRTVPGEAPVLVNAPLRRALADSRRIPVYPAALVLTALVTLFVNAGEPVTVLPRPVVMSVALVLGIQGVCSVLLRSQARGALAAASLILVMAGLWPLSLALLAVPAWWTVIFGLRRLQGRSPAPVEPLQIAQRALNVFSVFLLITSVGSGLLVGAFRFYGPPGKGASASVASASLPNIYLVQLDGYPGLDAVRATLGIDNESFGRSLEGLGFAVLRDSRSNYTQTWPTLASMFQMRYLEDEPSLQSAPADLGEQRRRLAHLINHARAFDELRAHGYRITTMPSAFSSATLLTADRVSEGGEMNEFEELVLRKSGVIGTLGQWGQSWVASQARARVEAGIDALGEPPPAVPTFVFDHVLAPHPPFLFEADGSPAPLRSCYPNPCPFWVADLAGTQTTKPAYGQALQAELTYLNHRVLDRVRQLVAADPSAVVILFSDHGMRFDPEDTREHFQIFFAARTPGRVGVFDQQLSLVNVFPELLNAYLGTDLVPISYEAWQSALLPLDLSRVQSTSAP